MSVTCAFFIPDISAACAHSGANGMAITYAPFCDSGGVEWQISWENATEKRFDLSAYKTFSFWIKGSNSGKFLSLYMLLDKPILVGEPRISTQWRQVKIPIGLPAVEQLIFRFPIIAAKTNFCLDDFVFEP